jgi:hypothetical protein
MLIAFDSRGFIELRLRASRSEQAKRIIGSLARTRTFSQKGGRDNEFQAQNRSLPVAASLSLTRRGIKEFHTYLTGVPPGLILLSNYFGFGDPAESRAGSANAFTARIKTRALFLLICSHESP